jgi:anthranilate synthase component 2
MKLLLLDNFDSFTYNVAHYIEAITGNTPDVIRNDQIDPGVCMDYDGIILSPGPGLPDEAGRMPEVIRTVADRIPLLGICLGMQAIAVHYGGDLINLDTVRHGIPTLLHIKDPEDVMFEGINTPFHSGSYHSWIVNGPTLPEKLRVTATDNEGNIMAISHKDHPAYGIQTHPESIMTGHGMVYIENFLRVIQKHIMSSVPR